MLRVGSEHLRQPPSEEPHPASPSNAEGYSTNSMGLLVSCSMALVSTKDDISKHLFLSGGWGVGGSQAWQGQTPSHSSTSHPTHFEQPQRT